MSFYLIMFAIILFLGLCARERQYGTDADERPFAALASLTILFIIAAARAVDVGKDTGAYEQLYMLIGMLDWNEVFVATGYLFDGTEPGYRAYNWFLFQLFPTAHAITFANSILLIGSVAILVRNKSQDPWLSVALFVALGLFQSALNTTMSAVAAAFVFSQIGLLENGRYLRFVLVVLFASIFLHTASLFLLILIPLKYVRLNRPRLILVIALGAIASLGVTTLAPAILGNLLPSAYRGYLASTRSIPEQLFVGAVLLIVVLFAWGYGKNEQERKEFYEDNLGCWIFALTMILYVFAYFNSSYSRLALLMSMYFIVFIPNIISHLPRKRRNERQAKSLTLSAYDRASLVIVSLTTVAYVARMSINNIGSTIPYEFFIG